MIKRFSSTTASVDGKNTSWIPLSYANQYVKRDMISVNNMYLESLSWETGVSNKPLPQYLTLNKSSSLSYFISGRYFGLVYIVVLLTKPNRFSETPNWAKDKQSTNSCPFSFLKNHSQLCWKLENTMPGFQCHAIQNRPK